MGPEITGTECELCGMQSRYVLAVGRTKHPDYAGYALCAECIAHYDELDADERRRGAGANS